MEKLLTARQVSDLLEVKVSTVYDWIRRGQIPYVKLGRLVRFKKTEIFRWVDSHTLQPRSPRGRKKGGSAEARPLQKEFPLS